MLEVVNSFLSLAARTPSNVQTVLTVSLAVDKLFGVGHTTDKYEMLLYATHSSGAVARQMNITEPQLWSHPEVT